MNLRTTGYLHGGIFLLLLLPGVLLSLYVGKSHIYDSAIVAGIVWASFVSAFLHLLWFKLFLWRCPSCRARLGRVLGNHCSNCGTDLRPHQ